MQLASRTQPIHREFPRITLVPSNPRLRPAKAAVAFGLSVLVVSTIGMLREVEPFATWYYQFAWYSVLLTADGALALFSGSGRLKRGEFLLLGKPAFLFSMLGWSAVSWFFYELLNFRLQNWYYIFLPESMAVRWLGTTVAFATVLPAVFIAEAILSSVGFARTVRTKPWQVTPRTLIAMRIGGAAIMALVLAWPRYFFALVWGASMLMIEPSVYTKARDRSLLYDLEQGRPGRLLRLLAGGALIGLLWESLNIGARAKWIYTVPFLENLKLFEMPVPGFLGFPPFAVECFIIWQALVTAGVAVPRFGPTFRASRGRRVSAALGGAVFCIIVLIGMELWTFTSSRPRITGLSDVPARRCSVKATMCSAWRTPRPAWLPLMPASIARPRSSGWTAPGLLPSAESAPTTCSYCKSSASTRWSNSPPRIPQCSSRSSSRKPAKTGWMRASVCG